MAKKPQNTAPAPAYEPDAMYRFTLMRGVTVFGDRMRPIDQHEAKGSILSEIVAKEGADVITAAERL